MRKGTPPLFPVLKVSGYVVLALMVIAIGYITYQSIANWNGIAV